MNQRDGPGQWAQPPGAYIADSISFLQWKNSSSDRNSEVDHKNVGDKQQDLIALKKTAECAQ